MARFVGSVLLVAVLAAGCASSGGSGGSLVVEDRGEPSADAVPAGEMDAVPVAQAGADEAGPAGDAGTAAGGVLVLVGAGVDWLSVRWGAGFAPQAASFELRWRLDSVPEGAEPAWRSLAIPAGTRTARITGLAAATRYRLRLVALDGDGDEGASATGVFETSAPPVRNLAAVSTAHRTVRLSWDAPQEWTPAGYVLRWRVRGEDMLTGEVPLGAPARSHAVSELSDAVDYVFEVVPLRAGGGEGDPATVGVTIAAGGLLLLTGAGADWVSVRWAQRFAPDAAGFRLRWHQAPTTVDATWSSVDLGAAVREHRIDGLTPGTPYRLWLSARDAGGALGVEVLGTFTTPTPAVRDLAGVAAAHDAVRLSWEGPAGWSPVGYVVQWRPRGANAFLGRLELPPGRRAQTVEGLTGGVEYEFRVTARTAAGTRSEPAAVVVTTPAAPDTDLVLEVSVPAYCIADEGSRRSRDRLDPDTGQVDVVYRRVDVASVPLQWRISGGQAPYTLTVLGAEHVSARGVGATEVSCAAEGLDLENLPGPETSVVEAGPKTLTIEAADATGDATTKTATIEIIETAWSASNALDGDYLQPGRTYSFFNLFIEIPEGARIAYTGASEAGRDVVDVFIEPREGSRWTEFGIIARSGEEAPPPFGRRVNLRNERGGNRVHYGEPFTDAENAFWDLFLANIRTTPFPQGDPRNEPPAPLARSPGGIAGQAAAAAPQCSDDGTTLVDFSADLWRPYGQIPGTSPVRHGLSCDRLVAVHPSLLVGDAITVCVVGGAMDGLLVPAITTATGEWNDLLAPDHTNPDPALRRGLGYAPFAFDAANPNCPTDSSGLTDVSDTDTDYVQVVDSRMDCNANIATACDVDGKPYVRGRIVKPLTPASADTDKSADPPRVTRNLMSIFVGAGGDHPAIEAELERLVRHELGHFLGLADYFEGCWRVVDTTGTVQPSTMSYGQLAGNTPDGVADPAGCRSDHAVTSRDLEDVHAIYHPFAVSALRLEESALAGRWELRWRLPVATPSAFNSAFLGVVRRDLSARDPVSGAPLGAAAWELFGLQVPTRELYVLPTSADVRGYEYAVVGLTRGDHERGEGADVGLGLRHRSLAMSGRRAWTAGSAFSSVSATPTRVAIAAGALPITEGGSAVFAVSRSGATASALTVDLVVAETGEMVAAGEEGSKSVTIPVGDSGVTFEVPTVEDGDIEDDSVITVSISSGTGYGVVPPGSASVTVTDDDLPLVAVAAGGSPVTEGASAVFAVSRTGATGSALTVELTVSESGGDMVAAADEGPRSVTIPAGDSSVSFTVATVDDSVVEGDGTITVSVTGGTGYGVVPPGSVSVVVTDDDTPSPAFPVSLRARSASPVTEGASLVFEVSRGFRDPATSPLTVNLRITETGDVVTPGEMASRSVRIAAGDRAVTFAVATVDDSVAESDSVVTVEVTDGSGYSFDPFYDSESVAVYDNDDPIPTVAIRPVTSRTFKDLSVEFTVIHTGAATSPVTVELTVTETGDMLYPSSRGPTSFTIPAGVNSATFSAPIVNDPINEWLSVVTAAVVGGAGYRVGSPGSALVVVEDDEGIAPVSVYPIASPVGEGTAAVFALDRVYGASTQPTTVKLRVSETGDMVAAGDEGLRSVTIPAGAAVATFEVATADDGDAEDDSVVTVLIVSVDDRYPLPVHPSTYGSSASVTIRDDENTAPRVTISPPRFAPTEGTAAVFAVSRSGATSSALTVALGISETGDVVDPSHEGSTSVTIPAGATSATLDVPTVDDTVDEDDSTVTATIRPGAGYAVGVAGSASIHVGDNDSALPKVTILRGTWDTVEGGAAVLVVNRYGPRGSALTVALGVSETGDVVDPSHEGSTSVTIPAGEISATLDVPTDDDTVDEDDSTITIAIVSGDGYTLGAPSSTSVPVYDNDDPPTVTIRQSFGATEGRSAEFIVSRAGSTASTLVVAVTITETGDMIDPTHEGSTSVTIPAGATSATLEVPTVDDTVDEDDSTVTATIRPGASYAVGEPNSASVAVRDNDSLPTITIRRIGSGDMTEGGSAEFTVSRAGSTASALTVQVAIAETGDMIDPSHEGTRSITIRRYATSATFEVRTVDDTAAEDHSTITVTITPRTVYTLGTPSSVTVTANDDDGTPTITFRSGGIVVTEGRAAQFTVHRSGPTTSPLTIQLTVTETGDMIAPNDEGPTSFTIPAGRITATFEVSTVDDTLIEDDSTVTVTISGGGGLTIGSRNSARATVRDNDSDPPTITIQPGTSPITEGAFARFTINRTGPTTSRLTIDLSITETGDMIRSDHEGSTSVTIRTGDASATFEMATVDDTADEDDSTITATIVPRTRAPFFTDRYAIGTPASATVTANDNDP